MHFYIIVRDNFHVITSYSIHYTKLYEVKSVGDDLNAQKTVLLNLETVKSEDAKRILDFLSGVAYANGATIKMMAQKTFAIMPRNVGFSGVDLMGELENNGYTL